MFKVVVLSWLKLRKNIHKRYLYLLYLSIAEAQTVDSFEAIQGSVFKIILFVILYKSIQRTVSKVFNESNSVAARDRGDTLLSMFRYKHMYDTCFLIILDRWSSRFTLACLPW